MAGISLMGIFTLGYLSIHNIRKSDEYINKGIKNTKEGIKNIIKNFNEGKHIDSVKGANGELLTGEAAYKQVLQNLIESLHIYPIEVEDLLKEHNLTQYKLYKLSGVAQSSISEIRSKKNKAPNLYIVYELAQGFGISLAEFFDCDYFKGFNIVD